MSGGVHPAEWIFPAVVASHLLYNASTNAADAQGAKVNTPGSANDKANIAQDQLELRQEAERMAAQERAAAAGQQAQDRGPAEAERARIRAGAAAELLGGGGRKRKASQSLTESTQYLSGAAR